MTDEEKQSLIERINTYWTTPHPDESAKEDKPELIPIHDFDRIPDDFMPEKSFQVRQSQWFQTDAHVAAARSEYHERMGYAPVTLPLVSSES